MLASLAVLESHLFNEGSIKAGWHLLRTYHDAISNWFSMTKPQSTIVMSRYRANHIQTHFDAFMLSITSEFTDNLFDLHRITRVKVYLY